MLELLAANIGHMYGDQASLPVHGDGPVVAALSDGLAIIDRHGVVQLWNPAAEQLTGRSAAEMLQRELHLPVPPPGQVLVHRLPSGRWLKVTAGDLPGTPAMRVVTFRDSTDQDRRHEDRDLFVAVTSHELRTPVTVIKGYADTLTNHWDSLGEDGRQEAVRVIGARAGELARLVDRLLSATSDDGEVGGSAAGPFDLVDGLRAAARNLPADLHRRLILDRLPSRAAEGVRRPRLARHDPHRAGHQRGPVFGAGHRGRGDRGRRRHDGDLPGRGPRHRRQARARRAGLRALLAGRVGRPGPQPGRRARPLPGTAHRRAAERLGLAAPPREGGGTVAEVRLPRA
nr:hypothetical protein GCM10020092_003420 [Actinoplanes digitatis]